MHGNFFPSSDTRNFLLKKELFNMPSITSNAPAAGKTEKVPVVDVPESFNQAASIVEKKCRNLEKRKVNRNCLIKTPLCKQGGTAISTRSSRRLSFVKGRVFVANDSSLNNLDHFSCPVAHVLGFDQIATPEYWFLSNEWLSFLEASAL